jgi:hypothetical protein
MSKYTILQDEHVFLLRIDVTRYEPLLFGNSEVGVRANCLQYVEEIIKAKPVDEVDGLKQPSLTAWADYCDVISCEVTSEDDEEARDPDADYWTITFDIIARFTYHTPKGTSKEKAEKMFFEELELILSDPMCDSLEEYACDFSACTLAKSL